MAMQCDGPYASSKFAGEGLSDSMRLELMKWGISVSLIVVGQIKTHMWGKLTGKNAPASTEVKKTSVEHELYGDLFREVERAVGDFKVPLVLLLLFRVRSFMQLLLLTQRPDTSSPKYQVFLLSSFET